MIWPYGVHSQVYETGSKHESQHGNEALKQKAGDLVVAAGKAQPPTENRNGGQ